MEIKGTAVAGTMESSDIMVTLHPSEKQGIEIDLNSTVEKQFGDEIRAVISKTLQDMGIQNVKVTAVDKGALDCTVRARTKAAACRATGKTSFFQGGANL